MPENITIENGGTLNLTGGVTLTNNITIEEGGILNLSGNVNLGCDIAIAKDGVLNMSGQYISFAATELSQYANITGEGTIKFSKTNGSAFISNLTNCLSCDTVIYPSNQSIIYEPSCTHMLPGTYYNAEARATEIYLCGDVTVTNQYWNKQGIVFNGEEGTTITLNFINSDANRTLTFNIDATITNNTNTNNRISAITVTDGKKLTFTGNTEINPNLSLLGDIEIAAGATLSLGGEHIYFANDDFSKTANITGAGTIKFSKNGTANVHRLTSCIDGITATYQYNQRVTYDNTCIRIIPGTYYNLTIDKAEMPLCGDVTVNNQFSAAQNMTLSCEEGRNPTLTVGNINYNNTNRNLTFNVNTTITDNTNYQNRISAITVVEGKKVTFIGNTNINTNVTLAGDIEIAEGATLNLGGEHTYFATDDLLTQKANIIGDGKVVFTKNPSSRIWRLTECQNCKFEYIGTGHVVYEGTSTHILPGTYNNLEVRGNSSITLCGDVTVNGWYWNKLGIEFNGVSGNEKITLNELKGDNNKWNYTFNVDATINGPFTNSIINLTVGDGKTVEINGNGTITGDLYLGANSTLAIGENKILTLNRALNVENNATLTGEGSGGYIAFTAEHAINVKAGSTLTINGIISNNSADMTLGGAFNITDGSDFYLSCSTVNFTPTSALSGSGILTFSANPLTIASLTSCLGDNVAFGETVIYAATSTRIIPAKYNNLTLNTADGKNITLCGSTTVEGTLTWNNGRIVLDGCKLALNGQPAVGAGSANHMVLTDDTGLLTYNMTHNESASGSTVHFYVGSYNSLSKTYLYAPVDIVGINADADYTVSIRTVGTALSGLATDLRRYWDIQTTGDAALVSDGSLILHYDAADDNLNYGQTLNADSEGYWRAYNGSTLINNGSVASPYTGNVITISAADINATEGLADNDINGIWTAAEYPKITTLYTFYNGAWDDPNVWTTDPTGKTHINTLGIWPNKSYDAVILAEREVIGLDDPANNAIAARTVQIARGGMLDIGTHTPDFNNVYGEGTLRIDGDFPTIGDYNAFVSKDGGTTEFYGSGHTGEIKHFEYNNLILNYDDNATRTFPNEERKQLNINGYLTISKGKINFSNTQQAIHIGSDLNISANGGIYIYRGTPGVTHYDTVQVGGNFINRGEFVLTLRDSYGHAEAYNAEGSSGRGVLRFTGEENARFECYNTTKMAQILLDKGTDHNSVLTVYSDSYDHFSLWGKAKDDYDDGEANFRNYISDISKYTKPIGLWRGTIELTGKIKIESLSEGGNKDGMMFYIPQTSGMIINGPDVKVYVRTDDGQTKVGYANFISAGYFRIESGLLDARAGSGISFRGTAIMEINGGTVRCSQFRPEQSVSNGIVTYIQTGGTFIVDGQGGVDATMPAFYMPFAANTFIMTGGTIDVRNSGRSGNNGKSTSNGGAFVVGCDPRVSSITGGEIIVNTGRASSGNVKCRDDYLISCAIPLWNLTLRNDSLYYGTSNTQWAYGGHRLSDHEGKVKNTTDVSFTCVTEIKNDLTICSGVKFYTDGKDLTIGGNLVIEDGAEVYTDNSEIIFNGNRLQDLTNNGTVTSGGESGFYSLTVNSGTRLRPLQNTTLRGTLTLHEGGELTDGVSNIVYTLYGNADISGTHPASANNGKIVFTGSADQTISGSGSGQLNHVSINKTGGTLQLTAPRLTITGNLRLLSDKRLDIGNNNLSLTSTANIYTDAYTATAFTADRMIATSGSASAEGLTRQYSSSRKSLLFPIGTKCEGVDYYLPAEISYLEASAFGSVTTRVVSGAHPFSDAENSLKCYWITDEQGFSGVNGITQDYWYSSTALVSGTLSSYVPARYHTAEWTTEGTGGVHESADMRYFTFGGAEAATGHYTCGNQSESAFAEITHLYSSVFAETEGGSHNEWNDPLSWTTTKVGDDPIFETSSTIYKYNGVEFQAIDADGNFDADGAVMDVATAAAYLVPTATAAVTIGSDVCNHTIVMNADGQGSASLTLAEGSTLNLGETTNHSFPLVDIETYGAGRLVIGSAYFPSGDFVKFLGANGGTVEYQNNSGTAFTMPDIATCRNLVISGTDTVQFLAADVHIFDNLKVSGQAQILNSAPHKLTIDGNLDIESGQMLLNCTAPQSITIGGDVKVFADALFTTDGSNATTHTVQIGGNLNAEGTFYSPNDNKNRIELTFVGTNTAYVTGVGKISVRTIICDKGTDMSAYLIIQNSNLYSSSDRELLKIKNGTCQIDIGDGNEISLSTQRDVTIESTARLSIKSGTARVANYNGEQTYHLILNGALEVLGGKLYVGHESRVRYSSIKYSPAGLPSITISGGQLIVNGAIRRQDGQLLGSLIYNQTGGEVIVMGKNRASENTTGNNNLSLALFEVLSTGEFTMTGGTLRVYGVDAANGESGTSAGDIFICASKATNTGGQIVVGDGATVTSQKLITNVSLNSLTVNPYATLGVYSYPLEAKDITIEDHGNLLLLGHTLTIKHGLYNRNVTVELGSESHGFVVGSENHTTYFTGSNMQIGGANGNVTNFANLQITGTLTLLENSDIQVDKKLTLTSGTVTDGGNTINLIGDVENNGRFISNTDAGGLRFGGEAATQYVRGRGYGEYGSVTVANPQRVVLNTDATINRKLTLDGLLYINVSRLTLGSAATVEAASGSTLNASRMILLNGAQEDHGVRKILPTGSSNVLIPIGIEGNYTPAYYSFAANTVAGATLTVKTVGYLNRNLAVTPPSYYLDYYWCVSTTGFNEENDEHDATTNSKFSVTQQYTYTDALLVDKATHGTTESSMLLEYLRTVGKYHWMIGVSGNIDVDENIITFNPMGHLEGEYTAGVVNDDQYYTELPYLYSLHDGEWDDPATWGTEPYGCTDERYCFEGHYNTIPDGNPVIIQNGHTVTVSKDGTHSYTLEFGGLESTLNVAETFNNDFGRVYGVGRIQMESTEKRPFMFPAGDFADFMNDPRSVVIFDSKNRDGVLSKTPGTSSQPLQNVIIKGSYNTKIMASDAWVINGDLTIESGATLDNTQYNTPIVVGGNWIDENTASEKGYFAGKSTVEFSGDSTQRILLNKPQPFYNVVINNSGALGSDSVIVGLNTKDGLSSFTVSNNIRFIDGYLIVDTTLHAPVLARTATATGASAASFVSGPIGRDLASGGNFTFPVGNNGRYAATPLTNVSAGGVWMVDYVDSLYQAYDDNDLPIQHVSYEYWRMYPPADGATAKIGLRYDSQTLPTVNKSNSSQLKKLTVAEHPADIWTSVESSRSGTVLTTTTAQVAQGYSNVYSIGYIGTTARFDENGIMSYTICDNGGEANIPILFTGTPDYTLTYTVKYNGVEVSRKSVKFSGDGNLTIAAKDLGFRSITEPYIIELATVSDASGEGAISYRRNSSDEVVDKAKVYVYYNALPEISGDDEVGSGDVREYAVLPFSGTVPPYTDSLYTWSHTGAAVGFAPANERVTNVTFGATGTTTLNAKVTYKYSEEFSCSNNRDFEINVLPEPTPHIVASNGLNACTGNAAATSKTYTYSTTTVPNHSYKWTVTNGTIKSGEGSNLCTVEWNDGAANGTITVEEWITGSNPKISGSDSKTVKLYTVPSLADVSVSMPNKVCYGTGANITISSITDGYRFTVYNSSGAMSGEISGSQEFSHSTVSITEAQSIYLVVANDGCEKRTEDQEIDVELKPDLTLADIPNLYIGKSAEFGYTNNNALTSMKYTFTYAGGGNDKTDETLLGIFEISVPTTIDRLSGTLQVKSEDGNLHCATDYTIDEPVSQEYLWKGDDADWGKATNWWPGSVPTTDKSAHISTYGKEKEWPVVGDAANVNTLTMESGATVTIDAGKTLAINGDVDCAGEFLGNGTVTFTDAEHNVSGSSVTFANLTNNGTVAAANDISVTGTLNNAGSFGGDGAVVLSGSNAQTIEGNGEFTNVTVNNASGISVSGQPTFNGAMTFANGIVTPAVRINVGATGTMTQTGNSWVNGEVEKTWADADKSKFDFVIGGSKHAAKVGVTPTANGATFTASYAFSEGADPITKESENVSLPKGLERVSQMQSWNIHGDKPSHITLYWDDFSGVTNANDGLVIAHEKTSGNWEMLTGLVSDNSITTQDAVSSYSAFTFGAKNQDPDINPLPVTFAAFTGRQDGNSIVLEWATASENNNNYFEIERSVDGVNYVTIGYVDGAGDSNALLGYQFTDNAPEQGQLYYRLSQVDFDGAREYADKVVTVLYTGSEIEKLTIVPNPTDGLFKVSASGSMAGGRIELLSQAGQLVRIVNVDSFDATIDISDLPSGIYVLRFVTDTKVLQQKVVKY
ncbi:MAG: T9SS type A sorting domain-containing protein [Salinivirgaceae bacterium]|nr:T9SS type A sorting domain-containing protein [Salinivirgaceae bacterium]